MTQNDIQEELQNIGRGKWRCLPRKKRLKRQRIIGSAGSSRRTSANQRRQGRAKARLRVKEGNHFLVESTVFEIGTLGVREMPLHRRRCPSKDSLNQSMLLLSYQHFGPCSNISKCCTCFSNTPSWLLCSSRRVACPKLPSPE